MERQNDYKSWDTIQDNHRSVSLSFFLFLQGQFSLVYIKVVRVNGPLKEANGPKM